MCDIEQARKDINSCDKIIAEQFEKRMRAAEDVFQYKKKHGLPIYDEAREKEVIEKNTELIENEKFKGYYIDFIKNLIDLSKKYQAFLQSGVKVAYSGIKGAFAHIAALKLYPDAQLVSYPDFLSAYNAVEKGDCDLAVLPIENSSAGEVGAVMDMIFDGDLYINGIYDLSISQNLLAVKGATINDIKTVVSHRQAIDQSIDYIQEHNFEISESTNTAIAAKTVADSNDKSVAAIASIETAKIYNLDILDRNINKSNQNTTRFAVLSKTMTEKDNENTVLLFTVSNSAGALAKAINIIGKYNYNMVSLRSRPLKEHPWKYYFYVEIDKNVNTELGHIMLNELREYCDLLKIAGTFTQKEI